MNNIKLYFKIILIKLFGRKEEKEDIQNMKQYYENMIQSYMKSNNIKSKRKAQKEMIKELKKFLIKN